VVVRDGRITDLGTGTAPTGATTIDGSGKFLIPGLWDMHVHLDVRGIGVNVFMPLDIANGVTGIRDMSGDCFQRPACQNARTIDTLRGWRKDIAEGRLVGPQIVASSPMLDGPVTTWQEGFPIATPDAARAAVHTFATRGVDFLKVYSLLPGDAFRALAAEANAIHLPFAGHVPIDVPTANAAEAGMTGMEHGYGLQEGCSSHEAALRADQRRIINDLIADHEPNLNVEPIYVEQFRDAVQSYDAAKCTALISTFVSHTVAQDPTLVLLRSLTSNGDSTWFQDPRLTYTPVALRLAWENWVAPYADVPNPRATRLARLRWMQQRVGEMQRAGVLLLAGTEAGSPFLYAGFSLHDELALFVESGLTPLEALRTATINPARYFHATDSLGTVAVGTRADLVLLDQDPLLDIHHTQTIRAVIADGRLYDRAHLDALLARVAAVSRR
jgi:imidazolonepropionase-like amidohydrolase